MARDHRLHAPREFPMIREAGVSVIASFADRTTEALFHGATGGSIKRIPPQIIRIAIRKLDMLNSARLLSDLLVPPGNCLESLRGNLRAHHSIREKSCSRNFSSRSESRRSRSPNISKSRFSGSTRSSVANGASPRRQPGSSRRHSGLRPSSGSTFKHSTTWPRVDRGVSFESFARPGDQRRPSHPRVSPVGVVEHSEAIEQSDPDPGLQYATQCRRERSLRRSG